MPSRSDWRSAAASLPTGFCSVCDQQVLLGEGESDIWGCVHCASQVVRMQLVAGEELGDLGYARMEEPAAGCGTGCGSGGCGVRGAQTTSS